MESTLDPLLLFSPYTSILATKEPYDHIYSYGAPLNVSEYAIRAQMVQFEQYRALFEGFRLHQWTYYSAVLMWKSQRYENKTFNSNILYLLSILSQSVA